MDGGGSGVGGGLAEQGASKMMEGEVQKNSCVPSLALKTRLIIYAICWGLGKS